MTDLGVARRRVPLASTLVASLVIALAGCGGGVFMGGEPEYTVDPGVRGDPSGFFHWANGEPTLAVGTVDPDQARDAVDRAAAVIDQEQDSDFYIGLIAVFDTAAQAEAHASDVRAMLEDGARWYADPANGADRRALDDPDELAPLIPPDAAAMKDHLLAAGPRGFGWGGRPGEAGDSVFTVGPLLVVTGLESEPVGSGLEAPLHPLAHLLAVQGADVVLEGDRFFEGSIVVDASCRITDAAGAEALRDDIGDAIATGYPFSTRPSWIGPALTDEQRLARATYRRWSQGMVAAMSDPDMVDLALQIASATNADEREAATRAFEQRMLERGQSKVEGELDPVLMALLLSAPSLVGDEKGHEAWQRDVGERMGRLPVVEGNFGEEPSADDSARLAITGVVRINGERLELGYVHFGRTLAGLPYLAAYLADQGCDDLRIGLVDYDTIRVD